MRWKALLALILIIGIIGLVTYGGIGKNLFHGLKVGGFTKTKAPTQTFTIALSSKKDTFYGQSYKITNSTFIGSGVCQPIKLNELTMQKQTNCEIVIGDLSGQFIYTSIGSIKLIAETTNIIIDGSTYSSPQPIKIDIELAPSSFSLGGISEDKISFVSITGEVKKLGNDTSVKSISYLNADTLDITKFVGQISLKDEIVTLIGITNSVKGNDFSW
jgi:hypothetical protein